MGCLILDILALYGCKSPVSTKSKDVSLSSKVLGVAYRYIVGQYKIYISEVQYKKYYTMLIRDYDDGSREIGSILRMIMVSKNSLVKDGIVAESKKDVHLEDLRKLIPSVDKIHGEEYQSLLSIIERRFIKCECNKLIICLDSVLSYGDLFNTLKKYLKNLDQCSIGLTQRVGKSAEVYCFEKTSG